MTANARDAVGVGSGLGLFHERRLAPISGPVILTANGR
jgi:hypothetical protein